MLKFFIVFINIALVILLLSLTTWFEKRDIEIQNINSKHLRDIAKLRNIPKINNAIEKYVKPELKVWPKSDERADLKLIQFFDRYAIPYHFVVNKYLYKDTIAHYLEIDYSIDRNKKKELLHFLQTQFKGGFIQFRSFDLDKEKLKGTIQLIQPFTGENNAS